jgi:hypothetical protein
VIDIAEIAPLWLAACQDAEYQPETQVALYLLPGSSGDGAAALHLEPGYEVFANETWPLAPNQLADANSAQKRNIHRILARDFGSTRVALGRLRHEMEHARQYDRSPQVYLAMSFARDALSRAFEERDPPSLAGSATLYNQLPFEEGANQVAAAITTTQFGPPSESELASTNAPLFRDASPIEPDTLALRILGFSSLFPAGFMWVAEQRGESISDLLSRLGPDGEAGWHALQVAGVSEYGRTALGACPNELEIQAAGKPADAWAAVKSVLQEGKEAAEMTLGSTTLDLF